MATINHRLHAAKHGGALLSTAVINGVAAGGLMTASIQAGYDNIISAPSDGYTFPMTDRLTQFVRGSIDCQDWVDVLNVLNGTVGTYVFYERESGLATYTRHTLLNPVIHQCSVNLTHRGRGTVNWAFECMAADENDTVTQLWIPLSGQTAPAAATAYAPGIEITAGTHGAGPAAFYHILGLSFNIQGQLARASGDSDVAYTAVDVIWGGTPITGTLTIQDSSTMQTLMLNAESNLVLTVKQSQGATAKTLTLKNVVFSGLSESSGSGSAYTSYALSFYINSDETTPLELSGANAAITIA